MAESLSNKISVILNAAPVSFDPEDDCDDTTAQIEYNHDDNGSDDELNLSKFRKQNVELLEEVDHRYQGTRASRKSLLDNDVSGSDESEGIDKTEGDIEDDDLSAEESNQEDASDSYDSRNDTGEDDYMVLDYNDADDNTKVFKKMGTSEFLQQSNKSSCVRQQLSIWENLLEMRIQIQKCLLTSNQFPQASHFNNLLSHSEEFTEKTKQTKTNVQNLLDKFLQLQEILLRRYPETKKIMSEEEHDVKTENEEEIPSDTDEDLGNDEDEVDNIPQKRLKLTDYKDELSRRFRLYHSYRNNVLQKWQDKTRIISNKSENVLPIAQQINHILNNKDKLIKATQLKRTDYSILCENDHNSDQSSDTYNVNIFDDTDFYHHLLRELIEFKSADLTDPIKLSRQWVQLQNLRSKMKKKVDTRATKGRKIRYVVHPKLVNFMAPIQDATWQESAKNELYNSLFGKNRSCKPV
ncbi:hypothetical protein RN001_010994 [Aquatica leii]|uniref:Protein AATF n=1 Tax=Aquatica leii TaxID=1421715 RepID=A0AAN7SNJ0_9COLE|nr:hypothetical protein RN001_010994 [Aquatica leii]